MQQSRDKISTVLSTAYIQDGELLVSQQFHRNYLGITAKLNICQQCCAFA